MAQRRLFPSFFLGGFECSTQIDRSRQRRDFVRLTQHDRFFREDYERARNVGIRAIREGVRWYLCERNGRFDFSSIAPMVDTAVDLCMTQINCLLHYGYPIDLDPLQPAFPERFAAFCAAYAEWRKSRVPAPRWYGVVNEISLFAHIGGNVAWFAPFFTDRAHELKVALVKAALEATDAIRRVDSDAHF
ncbi:MAG TPA: b-glycosidase, partial [Chloroflexota bacterium]|nr:b-glycosidase [Chloroflexota bacterium]